MLETDRGLASMRTWRPGALFGENEQKSVKMRAKPVLKRERRRRRRRKKKHCSLSFCFRSILVEATSLICPHDKHNPKRRRLRTSPDVSVA